MAENQKNNPLYTKDSWTNPDVGYINGTIITEYDLPAAAPSLIASTGSMVNSLSTMDKYSRSVRLGKAQQGNTDMAKELLQSYKNARVKFLEDNHLTRSDVLSVKRDAVFIIGDKAINGTVSGKLKFVPKNTYISYLNLDGKEFFLKSNGDLVVKGYNDEVVKTQKNRLFSMVKDVMNMRGDMNRIIPYLADFRKAYIALELPEDYYRSLVNNEFFYGDDVTGVMYSTIEYNESISDRLIITDGIMLIINILQSI